MPDTSECDRWSLVSDKAHTLNEFLEWLDGKGYFLARNVTYSAEKGACIGMYGDRKIDNVPEKTDDLVYEFFGIDVKKLDAERHQILKDAQARDVAGAGA